MQPNHVASGGRQWCGWGAGPRQSSQRQLRLTAVSAPSSQPVAPAAVEAEEAVTEDECSVEELDSLARGCRATVRLVSSRGGEFTVEGSMECNVPAQRVFDLLADYERVADVFSNVLRSTTYRVVGADTRLQQVCRWEFLVFSGKFPLELTVEEQPEQRRLTFSLASSPFMRSFCGTWQVHERPCGGSAVHHVMAVTPTLAPPRALAFYTRRVFERQVATIMEDLARAVAAEDTGPV